MINRHIDTKPFKQVRIEGSVHQLVKIEAARRNTTIRELVEEGLAEVLAVELEE